MGNEQETRQHPASFYEREGSSVIRDTLTRGRIIFFPVRIWATMEASFSRTFGTGSAVILQQMGTTYGREFGRYLKERRLGLWNGKGLIQSLARSAGWGDVTIEGDGEASIRFNVWECAFCTEAEERDRPSCHFLVGIAKGMVQELSGKEPLANETRCVRAGAGACVIELSLS